jgi:hypothetical protein
MSRISSKVILVGRAGAIMAPIFALIRPEMKPGLGHIFGHILR